MNPTKLYHHISWKTQALGLKKIEERRKCIREFELKKVQIFFENSF